MQIVLKLMFEALLDTVISLASIAQLNFLLFLSFFYILYKKQTKLCSQPHKTMAFYLHSLEYNGVV